MPACFYDRPTLLKLLPLPLESFNPFSLPRSTFVFAFSRYPRKNASGVRLLGSSLATNPPSPLSNPRTGIPGRITEANKISYM